MHALKLPRQAVSLGGVESLVVHAAAMWRGTMNDEQMRVAGIAPNAVRLSVGVEGCRRPASRPRTGAGTIETVVGGAGVCIGCAETPCDAQIGDGDVMMI